MELTLREPTTDTVVITLSAVRTPARLTDWALPELRPLEVVGEVAVVGLLLEERLDVRALESERLLPIDTSVLSGAFPAALLEALPGAPRVRPVAAYYAPRGSDQVRRAGTVREAGSATCGDGESAFCAGRAGLAGAGWVCAAARG